MYNDTCQILGKNSQNMKNVDFLMNGYLNELTQMRPYGPR